MSLIDAYLKDTAEKKTNVLWVFYDALNTATLTLIKGAPAVTFKVKIQASASGAHTDCAGTVTVNAEVITFTQAATKTTTTNLTVLPTITTANLDCNLKIWAIDTGNADIYEAVYTAFACRWEAVSKAFVQSTGTWTQSAAKVVAKTVYAIGDYLRKYGTTTEITIKRINTVTNGDGDVEYIEYTL
jgi:hypothetical protein